MAAPRCPPPPFPWAGELSAAPSSLCWATSGVIFMRIRPQPSAGRDEPGEEPDRDGVLPPPPGARRRAPLADGRSDWRPSCSSPRRARSGLALCDSILFRAFLEIGPRRTNVYMAMWPVWVAVLALLPPLAERPPVTAWIGMAVTIAGVVLADPGAPCRRDDARPPEARRTLRARGRVPPGRGNPDGARGPPDLEA